MAADFEWLARVFMRSYRVIAPDLRGRGHSDWATDLTAYGKYESVADLELVAQRLGLTNITVIGSSFGAAMATLFAARNPTLVRAVVLDDGGPPVERVVGTLLQHNLGLRPTQWAVQREFASLEDAAAYPDAWVGQPARPVGELAAFLRGAPRPSWMIRRALERFVEAPNGTWTWRNDMVGLHEGLVRYYQGPDPADPRHWEAVRSLAMPALLLHAGDSETFDADRLAKLRAANPRIRVVEVPGCRHTVLSNRPAEFLLETCAFLAEENVHA